MFPSRPLLPRPPTSLPTPVSVVSRVVHKQLPHRSVADRPSLRTRDGPNPKIPDDRPSMAPSDICTGRTTRVYEPGTPVTKESYVGRSQGRVVKPTARTPKTQGSLLYSTEGPSLTELGLDPNLLSSTKPILDPPCHPLTSSEGVRVLDQRSEGLPNVPPTSVREQTQRDEKD